MALIPVLKECTREYLEKEFELEFPLSEWVEIELNELKYEANRYDVKYRDTAMGKTISVYLYMNEGSDSVIAIDEVVNFVGGRAKYPFEETPFNDILEDIRTC